MSQIPSNKKQPLDNIAQNLDTLNVLESKLIKLETSLQVQEKRKKIQELKILLQKPDFWDNPAKAKTISQKYSELKDIINQFENYYNELQTFKEFKELLSHSPDEELQQDLFIQIQQFTTKFNTFHFQSLMNDPMDSHSAYLEIHPGAGGTESNDWASMLMRMYIRFAERKKWQYKIIEMQQGEEAGIKSCTLKITGGFSYGWLKYEIGVHRLVRISPFDSGKRRHTSFAAVSVYPVIDNSIHIEIDPKDLRIDTQRSSGAGGQHVNKTDSAVRITHIPTNTIVLSQNERSQIRNKDSAMKILQAKLYQLELQKQQAQTKQEHESKLDISFGSQIRSYVLHPYQMVKDIRTEYESSQPQDILDGNLDEFLENALENLS